MRRLYRTLGLTFSLASGIAFQACTRTTPQLNPNTAVPSAVFPLTAYDCSKLSYDIRLAFVRLSDNKQVLAKTTTPGDANFSLDFSGLSPGTYRILVSYVEKSTQKSLAAMQEDFTIVAGKGNQLTFTATPTLLDDDGDGFLNCEEIAAGSDPAARNAVPSQDTDPPTFDGALAADAQSESTITVSWSPASDRHMAVAALQQRNPNIAPSYLVVWSDKETGIGAGALDPTTRCTAESQVKSTQNLPTCVYARTSPGADSYSMNDLRPLQTYFIRVYAEDDAGNRTIASSNGEPLQLDEKTLLDNRPAVISKISKYSTTCVNPSYDVLTGVPDFSQGNVRTCVLRHCAESVTDEGCNQSNATGTVTPSPGQLDPAPCVTPTLPTPPTEYLVSEVNEGEQFELSFTLSDGETVFCDPAFATLQDATVCGRVSDEEKSDVRASGQNVVATYAIAPSWLEPTIDCTPSTPSPTKTCTMRGTPGLLDGGEDVGGSKTYLVQIVADDEGDGVDTSTKLMQIIVRNKGLPPVYAYETEQAKTAQQALQLSTCTTVSVPQTLNFDVPRGQVTEIPLQSAIDPDGDAVHLEFGPTPNNVWLSGISNAQQGLGASATLSVRPSDQDSLITLFAKLTEASGVSTLLVIQLHVFENLSAPLPTCTGSTQSSSDLLTHPTTQGKLVAANLDGTAGDELYVSLLGASATLKRLSLNSSGQAISPVDVYPVGADGALFAQERPFVFGAGELDRRIPSREDLVWAEKVGAADYSLRFLSGAASRLASGPAAANEVQTVSTLTAGSTEFAPSGVVDVRVVDIDRDGVSDILLAGISNNTMTFAWLRNTTAATGAVQPTFGALQTISGIGLAPREYVGIARDLEQTDATKLMVMTAPVSSQPAGTPSEYDARPALEFYSFDPTTHTASRDFVHSFDAVVRLNDFTTQGLPSSFGQADINADGILDIVLGAPSSSDTRVWMARRLATPTRWSSEGGTGPSAARTKPFATAAFAWSSLRATSIPLASGSGRGQVAAAITRNGAADVPVAATLVFGPANASRVVTVVRLPNKDSGGDMFSRQPALAFNGGADTALNTVDAQVSGTLDYTSGQSTLFVEDFDDDGVSELGAVTSLHLADDTDLVSQTLDSTTTTQTVQTWTRASCADPAAVWPSASVNLAMPNRISKGVVINRATASAEAQIFNFETAGDYTRSSQNLAQVRYIPTLDTNTRQLASLQAGASTTVSGAGVRPSAIGRRLANNVDQPVPATDISVWLDVDADTDRDLVFFTEVDAGLAAVQGQLGIALAQSATQPGFSDVSAELVDTRDVIGMVAADFDRNTTVDVVLMPRDGNTIDLYRGVRQSSGGITFGTAQTIALTVPNGYQLKAYALSILKKRFLPSPMLSGDFNQDGFVDLAIVMRKGTQAALGIWLGRPELTTNDSPLNFSPATVVDLPGTPDFTNRVLHLVSADFTGDRRTDFAVLLTRHQATTTAATLGSSSLWLVRSNGGSYQTSPAASLANVDFVSSLAVADLNGDNAPELVMNGLVDLAGIKRGVVGLTVNR